MILANGGRLGSYEILAAIGVGGMGEVYKARDTRLDRVVAIKVLTAGDEAAGDRLRREARAAAALNHPHICTIHEIADIDDRVFIVMEHVDGRRLNDLVVEGIALSSAIRYATQIADALEHAHERGIVHRDLKSANLMIAIDGRVKVLDFGIAQRLDESSLDTITRMPSAMSGAIPGTVPYMAPEVLRGTPADRRSDIWALGVVLYEMTSGRRPFGGDTSFELSSAILRDEPIPLPSQVPRAVRAMVARCLAKDPAARYQRAGEVRAALETIAADVTTAPARRPRAPRAPTRAKSGRPRIRSLAVLPLDNLTRDPEQEYFADGMTEALIGAVAQIDGLRVISRTSIMRYKGTQKTVPEIARELSVDAIISGSVRRVGDRVRISAHLVDAATDTHVWTASYDRDLGDVLALETEIGSAVANEMTLKLRSAHKNRAPADRKIDPETYALYLKGRHLRRQVSETSLRQAIECFERTVARDPLYASAYAALADAYHWLAFLEWASPTEAYGPAGRAAAKALELDPDLADAHMAVGSIKFNFEWDWVGAERAFRRAIDINPNDIVGRSAYSLFLGNLGRLNEAIEQAQIARDTDPLLSQPHQGLGYWSFLLGHYDDSRAHHEAALQLDPNAPISHVTAGFLKLSLGSRDEALDHFRHAALTSGGNSFFSSCLAYACAVIGLRPEAERIVHDLEKRAQTRYVSRASLSWAYIGLDNIAEALRCLRTAHEQHDSVLVSLPSFTLWDPIRNTDVFRDIVARMKFPGPVRQAPLGHLSPSLGNATSPSVAHTRIQSLAVLPLENLSRDPEQEYFADGMTEALISDLAQISTLRVISRTSVMRFKGTTMPVPEIARALGVDGVVTGSVMRAGERVRIAAQLIHASTDAHVWAESYDRDLTNVLALQRDVAHAIAGEIRATTGREPPIAERPFRTVDPSAYNEYLRGLHHAHRFTEPEIRKGLERFQAALAHDPVYGPAHAGLAICHLGLGWLGAVVPHQAFPRAKAAARRALEIDESLLDARLALGYVATFYEWDWMVAEQELGKALALQPGAADAHLFHAWYLNARSRHDDAAAAVRRAFDLDPLSALVAGNVGYLAVFARRFDIAEHYARQALDIDPANVMARWTLGIGLAGLGRYEESIGELEACARQWRGVPIVGWLGYVCARAGAVSRARELLSSLEQLDPTRTARSIEIARIHVGLGDGDRALGALAEACDAREGPLGYMKSDPCWDPIRADGRFVAILRRIGIG